jgi:Pretoxin HINT domain
VTGERSARRVTHVWVHRDLVMDLVIDAEVVTTTADHPFWSITDGEWQRADALEPADELLTAAGARRSVTGVATTFPRVAWAFNLAVGGAHTFHVGRTTLLVHNQCPDAPSDPSNAGEGAEVLHGPFHRIEGPHMADEMAAARSGTLTEVQGETNRQGFRPSVDARRGPLPPDARGHEFVTPVAPRAGTAPWLAQWPQGHPGVRDVGPDRVAIPCTVTRCQ